MRSRGYHTSPALRTFLILVTCCLTGSCSLTRIMPVQMTRIAQVEYFTQSIVFPDTPWPPGNWDSLENVVEQNRRTTIRLDSYLNYMLGEQNWQRLKESYGLPFMRDELLEGKLSIRGFLNMTLSLMPTDTDAFFIEGTGRFFLLRNLNNEILFNGDFLILPRPAAIRDLAKGYLDVDIRLLVSRIPGQSSYLHDAHIVYRIFVDTRRAADNIFAIDYHREHQVFMKSHQDLGDKGTLQIGFLRFDDDVGEHKLLDLRGREFLRQYERMDLTPSATRESQDE